MGDTVSRKALIDSLNKRTPSRDDIFHRPELKAKRELLEGVVKEIESLPSTEGEDALDDSNDMQMTAELGRLSRENERLRAALEWYADKNNWWMDAKGFVDVSIAEQDGGKRAREALKEGEKT